MICVMSRCSVKGVVKVRVYSSSHAICLAVQTKGLLKSGSTPVAMLCLAVQ